MSKPLQDLTYFVSGREGFSFTEALRLWKTKYSDIKDFEKEVIKHPSFEPLAVFVRENWDDIQTLSINDALTQENAEIRRVYFDCIGVQRLFTELQPVLRDRQVIKKKRTKWDDNNDQTEYEFEDVYELYEIEGTKLFSVDRWGNKPNPVYAVRCWCTTTNREYWLYVSPESATGSRWAWSSDHMNHKYDAIRAIAWTIRIDIPEESVDRIYRQGDIIVVKSKVGQPVSVGQQYHISKEMYLSSMYSET